MGPLVLYTVECHARRCDVCLKKTSKSQTANESKRLIHSDATLDSTGKQYPVPIFIPISVPFHCLRNGLSVDVSALAKEVYGILKAPPPRSPERGRRNKSQFFLNSSNKKAKSVTLHIQGLDSTVCTLTTHTAHPFPCALSHLNMTRADIEMYI